VQGSQPYVNRARLLRIIVTVGSHNGAVGKYVVNLDFDKTTTESGKKVAEGGALGGARIAVASDEIFPVLCRQTATSKLNDDDGPNYGGQSPSSCLARLGASLLKARLVNIRKKNYAAAGAGRWVVDTEAKVCKLRLWSALGPVLNARYLVRFSVALKSEDHLRVILQHLKGIKTHHIQCHSICADLYESANDWMLLT